MHVDRVGRTSIIPIDFLKPTGRFLETNSQIALVSRIGRIGQIRKRLFKRARYLPPQFR